MGTDTSGSIEQARNRNLQRWPDTGNETSGDYEVVESAYIQQWLSQRLTFVDQFINELPGGDVQF